MMASHQVQRDDSAPPPCAKKTTSAVTERNITLQDYIHMHGMLCRPDTARRTLNSFDGRIMFLPFDYYKKEKTVVENNSSLEEFDCHDFTKFTVFMYYLLVICSFTGISTLLKQTKILVGREENEEIELQNAFKNKENQGKAGKAKFVSEHNTNLQVHLSVLSYVKEKSGSKSIRLKRRFEYEFEGIAKLSVMMLHFYSPDTGLLHLVEVYQFRNSVLRKVARILVSLWHWTRVRLHLISTRQKPITRKKNLKKK